MQLDPSKFYCSLSTPMFDALFADIVNEYNRGVHIVSHFPTISFNDSRQTMFPIGTTYVLYEAGFIDTPNNFVATLVQYYDLQHDYFIPELHIDLLHPHNQRIISAFIQQKPQGFLDWLASVVS